MRPIKALGMRVIAAPRHGNGPAAPICLATSASLVAQYLLNRKRIESWFVWIAVDVAFAALAIASELWITAGLYMVFIVLCVYGYRSWKAIEQHTDEHRPNEQRDSGEHSTADAPRLADSSGRAVNV
jgi:nicotinamide riboside transporter PnuC